MLILIFSTAVYAAVAAGVLAGSGRFLRPWPVLTTVAALVIGAVSVLQLAGLPVLRDHLQRDATAVRAGEVWRLVTSLAVQDGGWVGLASNLLTLVLIGVVAERLFSRRRWVLAFAVPALVAEVVGLWWQPVGAGNSVAVAGLCGAVAVTALRRGLSLVPALISTVAFLVLALAGDVHGVAGVAGILVGLIGLQERRVP